MNKNINNNPSIIETINIHTANKSISIFFNLVQYYFNKIYNNDVNL